MNRKNIILGLIALFTVTYAFSQSAKEIAKSSLPSTVSLVMEDNYKQPISLGSGFIVGDGRIVTNLHVIEGAKYGSVFVNGSSKKHKIEGYFAIDKVNDLAILSVPTISDSALPLGNASSPEVGEKIYAIGNPKGLSGTISEGIVSGIRNLEGKDLIQITAPISPGSSGGPVIDNNGRVIGVAVGTLNSGQNLNFAIPAASLLALLDKQGNSITSLNVGKGATAPKTSKSEKNIVDGVEIVNVEWQKINYSIPKEYRGSQYFEGFSVKNNLPYSIKNIKVLFILKKSNGSIIDYTEEWVFTRDVVKPFLTKYNSLTNTGLRVFERLPGEILETRVLDFTILED